MVILHRVGENTRQAPDMLHISLYSKKVYHPQQSTLSYWFLHEKARNAFQKSHTRYIKIREK